VYRDTVATVYTLLLLQYWIWWIGVWSWRMRMLLRILTHRRVDNHLLFPRFSQSQACHVPQEFINPRRILSMHTSINSQPPSHCFVHLSHLPRRSLLHHRLHPSIFNRESQPFATHSPLISHENYTGASSHASSIAWPS
jgi:hypothetical protein